MLTKNEKQELQIYSVLKDVCELYLKMYGFKWYRSGLKITNNSAIAYCNNYSKLEFGIITKLFSV